MSDFNYTLIRSARKTISLEITGELTIIVRAPLRMTNDAVTNFVNKHNNWISKHLEKRKQQLIIKNTLTPAQIIDLKHAAKKNLPQRTAFFADIMHLYPISVKITSAKKRFGSCNTKNSICFSWQLMLYPPSAIDYVIVHELAHIKHKNHGKAFYALIEEVLPDYKERIKLLK